MTDPLSDETIEKPMGHAQRVPRRIARLRVVYPNALRAEISLDRGETVLGRQPGARGFAITHSTVSRVHASIRWSRSQNAYQVRDHDSRNGTRTDGRLLPAEVGSRTVQDGSVVRIGDVLMVLEVDERLQADDPEEVSHQAIFGDSAAVVRLRADIMAAAADPSPVLIIGETGTGKENVARELHRLSGRSGPMIPLNCAALSPQLVESQLFGHRRGAFTGAQGDSDGVFRSAEGGTVFLDEVGELPLELQPKLLRVLQEGEVQPVGEARPQQVNVRVIAATLRDLAKLAEDKRFRLDLYARLSPWEVQVPALTQRRADLLSWLHRLYRLWHEERGRRCEAPLPIDPDSAERLLLDSWPDNLRGLERLVHRLCSRPEVPIAEWLKGDGAAPSQSPPPLPPAARSSRRAANPSVASLNPRERPSKEELERLLAEHGGSVRATAKELSRDRRQIYRWMDLYGLRGVASDDG